MTNDDINYYIITNILLIGIIIYFIYYLVNININKIEYNTI